MSGPARTTRKLGIPAYFHPVLAAADWSGMAEVGGSLRAVIVNVDSGPGSAPDPAWEAAASRMAGVTSVIGYVDTGYGTRPMGQVLAEAARYLAWYPVSGVFLDQVATQASQLPWYQRLTGQIRDIGAREIVLNPGTVPLDPGYAEIAEAVVTFEGPYSAYQRLQVPAWLREFSADRFWHLVYAAPRQRLGSALQVAWQQHAGTIFITDGTGANPWNGLPEYFVEQAVAWSVGPNSAGHRTTLVTEVGGTHA